MLYDPIQGMGHDYPIMVNFPRDYIEMQFWQNAVFNALDILRFRIL